MLEKILAALEALTAAVAANTAAMGGTTDAAKPVTRTRAQKAIDTANAAPPTPAPAPPAPSPAPATASPVTMEQAIALTKDLAKVNRQAAVDTLARHGAAKATELKAEVLPAYVADLQRQLTPAPAAAAGDGLI